MSWAYILYHVTLFPSSVDLHYIRDFAMKRYQWPYTVFIGLYSGFQCDYGTQASSVLHFFRVGLDLNPDFLGLLVVLLTATIEIFRRIEAIAIPVFSIMVFAVLRQSTSPSAAIASSIVLLGAVIFMILQLIDYGRLILIRRLKPYQWAYRKLCLWIR